MIALVAGIPKKDCSALDSLFPVIWPHGHAGNSANLRTCGN